MHTINYSTTELKVYIIAIIPYIENRTVTPPPSTTNSTGSSSSSLPSPTLLPHTCTNPKYTHKVYLCDEEHGMALEDTRNDTVQLYNWIEGGIKNIQYMTTKQFMLSECARKFQGFALLSKLNHI